MTIQRTRLPLLTARLLITIACINLGGGTSFAQGPPVDPMQIDPPPLPRYRRTRPVFEVTVDPNSKPLPPPTLYHESPSPPPLTVTTSAPSSSSAAPSPVDLAKQQKRLQAQQREDATSDRQQELLANVGKALGLLLVVGVCIFAVSDIVRQIRKAKHIAAIQQEDEDYLEDDPLP